MSNDAVIFQKEKNLGIISLNAPETLNSLTKSMCQSMASHLGEWAEDEGVRCVLIESTSPKALCAGGDVVSLYESMRDGGSYHCDFFKYEYALDLMIHQYAKPVVVFGHGIVMGGGIGIMNGASHRIVTETTLMAMPEITIGFFPDVGGSYFLSRMPGHLGRFLGLTGARLNGRDALYVGMADDLVPSQALSDLRQSLIDCGDPDTALSPFRRRPPPPEAPSSHIRPLAKTIEELMEAKDIFELKRKIEGFQTQNKWLDRSLAAFKRGSPTSMAVIFEQIKRGRDMELPEVFAMEKRMATHFGKGHDMPEGVRALLVDKDKNPRWQPGSLEGVTPQSVEAYFS